jgi:RNA polymerase sigma factor (sigma-70 family)
MSSPQGRSQSGPGVPSMSLSDLQDEELWQHCRRGGQAAWAVLVRRYQRLIYTIPRRAGLSDEAAADVFQFTFARLFENLDRLDDASRLRAWLVTTAKRESLRLIELSRRMVQPAPASPNEDDNEDPMHRIPDPAPLAESLLADLQEQDAMRRAVDKLDDKSRRFVELLFLQEEPLPYAEIAARLRIAEGSIGPTRARVLVKLRALMAELR